MAASVGQTRPYNVRNLVKNATRKEVDQAQAFYSGLADWLNKEGNRHLQGTSRNVHIIAGWSLCRIGVMSLVAVGLSSVEIALRFVDLVHHEEEVQQSQREGN